MKNPVEKIKELRNITGVNVYDCDWALSECWGDVELATIYLRELGQALYRRVPFAERYAEELEEAKQKWEEEV